MSLKWAILPYLLYGQGISADQSAKKDNRLQGCTLKDFASFKDKTITPKPYSENFIELLDVQNQLDCKQACCTPPENTQVLGASSPNSFTCYGSEYKEKDKICYLYSYNPNDIFLKSKNDSIFFERIWEYELIRPNPFIVKVDFNERKTFIEWMKIPDARYYVIESLVPRYGFPLSIINTKYRVVLDRCAYHVVVPL